MNTKRHILLVVSVVLWLTAAVLLFGGGVWALLDGMAESINASPERLVYHTNHTAVLQACRAVIANPQANGFPKPDKGYSVVEGSQGGAPAPATLPAVLRDLKFESMNVEGDRAIIWFGSGFEHWGYSTSASGHVQGFTEMQLIPGLWFWSEGNHLPRDTSKFPYYRTSKRLLIGGTVAFAAAIALMIYRRRSATALSSQTRSAG